jgi:hypothetical protein
LYEPPPFQDETPLWLDEDTFLVVSIGTATGVNGWSFVWNFVVLGTFFSNLGRFLSSGRNDEEEFRIAG